MSVTGELPAELQQPQGQPPPEAVGPHSLAASRPWRRLLNENVRAALQKGPPGAAAKAAKDLMTAIALCNTVMPQLSDDGHGVKYQVRHPQLYMRFDTVAVVHMTYVKKMKAAGAASTTQSPMTSSALEDCNVMPRQASSPDEEALVQGASMLGFTLTARTHDKVPAPASHLLLRPASQLLVPSSTQSAAHHSE